MDCHQGALGEEVVRDLRQLPSLSHGVAEHTIELLNSFLARSCPCLPQLLEEDRDYLEDGFAPSEERNNLGEVALDGDDSCQLFVLGRAPFELQKECVLLGVEVPALHEGGEVAGE